MSPRYDAVVVGSGPNGLAAANTLSERGWSVLVLEGQETIGGGMRTDYLTLPGFRHDTFSAVHPAAVASPVFERWDLQRAGLSWVQPSIAMAHPMDEGRCVALHRSLHRTRSSLNRSHAGDGDRWASFVGPYLNEFQAVRSTVMGKFPPVVGAMRAVARLGVRDAMEFLKVTLGSASATADDLFSGDAARTWFYGLAMHSDVSPRVPGSAVMGLHLALLGHAVGWPSPERGASSLADALVNRLERLGGELRIEAPAEEVLVKGKRIVGVRAGGRVIPTTTALCAVAPPEFLRLSSDRLPDWYRSKLSRFRKGPGVVKIDWALGDPIPWLADDARLAGTVHVGAGSDELLRSCDVLQEEKLPREPFLILGQQSLADGTRAPKDRHTAWCYARVGEKSDEEELRSYAKQMESQIERFAPGFGERILARHILTPKQMQATNSNLVGGDIGGGSYSLDQMLFRPLPSLSPYRTPIAGLYLASASTFPGGSVHGVCGWAAARCALWDSRLKVGLRRGGP